MFFNTMLFWCSFASKFIFMKKYLTSLPVIFIAFFFVTDSFSQRISVPRQPIVSFDDEHSSQDEKSLEAFFLIKDRFGSAPMTVFFKDMTTTGQPDKWLWNFGDGVTDTVKDPLHTYESPGRYTVKLVVMEGGNTSSVTRNNYIVVAADGACDTLAFPLVGTYTIYVADGDESGYLAGNNTYGDLAKASYFDEFSQESVLIGGIFHFAVAKRSLASNTPIKFLAWNSEPETGVPGNVMAETQIAISQLAKEVEWGWPTFVFFNDPPSINASFFLGLELPQVYGDTLALYTNEHGDVVEGNGWEQHENGPWFPYSATWQRNIDNAIFPLVCQSTGVSNHYIDQRILIYPVPASNEVNIMLLDPNNGEASLSLFDAGGKLVYEHPESIRGFSSIDVTHLKKGIYFLRININGVMMHRKVLISR
jgi:PKD repeat protein